VPFGLEELHRIDVAGRDAELGLGLIEVHRARLRVVEAAQIDGQLAVDEDPEIVVAHEGEALAAVVLEGRVNLGREAEVVYQAVVGLARVAVAGVVEREVVQALEGEQPTRLRRQRGAPLYA